MNLFYVLLTLAVLVGAAITRPGSARCPDGMYVELRGDRGNGDYECRPAAKSSAHEPRGHEDDERYPDDPVLGGRIYCSGGQRPIVVDDKTVGCQKGGWR